MCNKRDGSAKKKPTRLPSTNIKNQTVTASAWRSKHIDFVDIYCQERESSEEVVTCMRKRRENEKSLCVAIFFIFLKKWRGRQKKQESKGIEAIEVGGEGTHSK